MVLRYFYALDQPLIQYPFNIFSYLQTLNLTIVKQQQAYLLYNTQDYSFYFELYSHINYALIPDKTLSMILF